MEEDHSLDICLLHLFLPDEMIFEIFSFAAPRDCLRIILCLVCKKWYHLARLEKYKWSEAVPSLLSSEDLFVETTDYTNSIIGIEENPCNFFRRQLKYPPLLLPFPLGAICDAACEGELEWCEYLIKLDPRLAYWANSFLYCAVANGHKKIMDWSQKLGATFGMRVVCVAALGGYGTSYSHSISQCSPDQLLFTEKNGSDYCIQDRIYLCIGLGGSIPMVNFSSISEDLDFIKVMERPIHEKKAIVPVMLYGSNDFVSLFMNFVCDEENREYLGGLLLECAKKSNIAILCKCVLDMGVKIPEYILQNMAVFENVDMLKVFQDQIKKDWLEEQSIKEE